MSTKKSFSNIARSVFSKHKGIASTMLVDSSPIAQVEEPEIDNVFLCPWTQTYREQLMAYGANYYKWHL